MFRNPCRKCIIRPMCKEKCHKLLSYIRLVEIIWFASLLGFFITIMLGLLVIIAIYSKFIAFSALVLIIVTSIISFVANGDEFFDLDGVPSLLQILLLIIIIPTYFSYKIWEKYDELDITYYKMNDLRQRHWSRQ